MDGRTGFWRDNKKAKFNENYKIQEVVENHDHQQLQLLINTKNVKHSLADLLQIIYIVYTQLEKGIHKNEIWQIFCVPTSVVPVYFENYRYYKYKLEV